MINLKKISSRFTRGLYQKDLITPPVPGLYHYKTENGSEETRLHLRVEKDGKGLLLVNANHAYHLNPTATYMAFLTLEKVQVEEIVNSLIHFYHVSANQAKSDVVLFSTQFSELIRPDGACPICDLELETTAPFSDRPSAPYRMDLALTYRCNNDCAHCYNSRTRKQLELTSIEWKKIIDRLWKVGIPHIVFTGGEPTLRPDLPALIAGAEANGQITGLNTNGRKLRNKSFVNTLVQSGLDHVQITLESHDTNIHDQMVQRPGAWTDTIEGIKNALESRLFVMTNTTLLKTNASPENLVKTLEFLAELGVPTVGLNALIYSGHGLDVNTGILESQLPPLLDIARELTQKHNQRLIWYTPTQYCHFDPLQMELGIKGCTAALYNMCVEPDGSVIPCQSYYSTLGNLLNDPWESIWEHDLAVSLRERRNVAQTCKECAFLPECGGGCPLAYQANQICAPKAISAFELETLGRTS